MDRIDEENLPSATSAPTRSKRKLHDMEDDELSHVGAEDPRRRDTEIEVVGLRNQPPSVPSSCDVSVEVHDDPTLRRVAHPTHRFLK
jgi:hypothetical protein